MTRRPASQLCSLLLLVVGVAAAAVPAYVIGCRSTAPVGFVDPANSNRNHAGAANENANDNARADRPDALPENDNVSADVLNENAGNIIGNDNVNGDGDEPIDTNGPAPLFTFAVIGDYGADVPGTRWVAALIKSWEPAFIITTGDNDYSDGYYRGTFQGLEYGIGQYFHEYIGNYLGTYGPGAEVNRFFPTPGNHDWGGDCSDPGGLDDYLRYFTLPDQNSGNERYYDFVWGPIHFFSLHSVPGGCEPDGITADSVQAQWVREWSSASDARFKIAYFHNPPYSSGEVHAGGGVHMRWPWADWGFDLTLSGDDHVYERIERDGFVYVVNGLGGVVKHDFLPEPEEGSVIRFNEDFGALKVDVFDDRLDFTFLTRTGRVIDEFSIR